jgi:predicted YcjX-like family ATPase
VLAAARELLRGRRVVRIGITGLARAGKTALLTSLAANLLAAGAGFPTLPALAARLGSRRLRVAVAPSGAQSLPRFDHAAHIAALAADPPRWPARTDAVSLLALDLDIGRTGLASALPSQRLRLELLDYPGEWLLDLPLLSQSFATWSDAALRRLEPAREAGEFLGFVRGLPAAAPADETLARTGATLYRALLRRQRDAGMSLLQPGRFLMPAPGPEPPWCTFFPLAGSGPLAALLGARYDKYVGAVAADLSAPSFGRIDRLVVLADVLSALHAGPVAFADAAAALAAVARSLRWRRAPDFVPDWLAALVRLGGITRVTFAASKSDHVADRQRGNLAALVAALTRTPGGTPATAAFAVASVRCTEDFVWTLDGRPVSAVRGRVLGDDRPARSYPGEVPDSPPDAGFWMHAFLSLPDFEPMRLPLAGRGGVPHINLDRLLAFLLEDVL